MKFILTSEGRLLPTANGFEREYFLSDHLGNTRVIFGKNAQGQAEIKQVVAERRSRPIGKNHYYAYGMEIADQSLSSTPVPNTFLYNGKEYDTNTGYYQYGFRQYDAQIGRWWVVDAMSETYYSTSPYMYVMGNPVMYYDVMGLNMQLSLQDIINDIIHGMGENQVGHWRRGGGIKYYSSLSEAQEDGVIIPYMLPTVEIVPIIGANRNRLGYLTKPLSLAYAIKVRNDILYAHYRLWEMTPDYLKDDVVDWRDMLWGPSNRDDNPYLPWKPDAIQLEIGVSLNVIGVINYSAGAGITTSKAQTAIHTTSSYTLFPRFDFNLKNLKLISFGPYVTFNMMDNLTANPKSLKAYEEGGVTTTLGLGLIGFNYGTGADTDKAFRYGPFAPTVGMYNAYGFTLNPGIGFSRTPTYTKYWFIFNH